MRLPPGSLFKPLTALCKEGCQINVWSLEFRERKPELDVSLNSRLSLNLKTAVGCEKVVQAIDAPSFLRKIASIFLQGYFVGCSKSLSCKGDQGHSEYIKLFGNWLSFAPLSWSCLTLQGFPWCRLDGAFPGSYRIHGSSKGSVLFQNFLSFLGRG